LVPEITLLSGSDTVDCYGTPIHFEGSWTGGDGLSSGAWESGSGNMLRWDTILGNTTYYLYVWDECSADSVVDSLTIYLRASPPISTQSDSLFTCYSGDSLRLAPVYSGGSGVLNFAWEDGNTDNPRGIRVNATGYHRYSVTDVCGQSASDSILVFLPPPVVAAFGWLEDFSVQLGVRMSNFSQNAVYYFWDFGDGDTSTAISPKHRYSKPGTYTVRLYASDRYGCSDFTQVVIEVKQEFNLYIPDAFSPNGDNINETFLIQGGGIKDFSIRIFNRWGEEVYFSEDIEKAWDGTFKGESVPSGVYYFNVNLKLPDNKIHQEQGSLILFR
jgi:gliding motility-associated-like protein